MVCSGHSWRPHLQQDQPALWSLFKACRVLYWEEILLFIDFRGRGLHGLSSSHCYLFQCSGGFFWCIPYGYFFPTLF